VVKKILFFALFILSLQSTLLMAEFPRQQGRIDFSLPDLENKQVSLSDFRGQPVILIFWTSWCPFCRKELATLNTMYPELTKGGVKILAINAGESAAKVKSFIEHHNLLYKVLMDSDIEVSKSMGVFGVPTYILINKNGDIVFQDNYFPQQEYKKLILK